MDVSIKVKILQVLHGDGIIIQYTGDDGKNRNIFIDGGFASTYTRTLRKETERLIQMNEKIDLFVITHTDRDHIGGVLRFVKDFGANDIVDKYWFNHSNLDVAIRDRHNKISISQGISLRDYLSQMGKLHKQTITNEIGTTNLYGAEFTILSPTRSDLENYEILWRDSEHELKQSEAISAKKNDYSESIDKLSRKAFREDRKLENRVSITFIFQVKNKSVLFLADSHPSVIVQALKLKGYSRENKLKVDYVKLSHHASKFNTNDELLSMINCSGFIISANGKNKYYFPHKEPLARIVNNPERNISRKIHFVFNYDNDVIRSIFNETELEKYNFSCLYPNGNENGYTINL